MLKRAFQVIVVVFLLLVIGGIVMAIGGVFTIMNPPEARIDKPAILAMNLDGVIINSQDFIRTLSKYRKKDNIKGVLVRINSPGGVVGPSQEIYEELKRTSQEFKKPVYVYCSALAASGAYYAAMGADKIFTTPGCTMGSIGVLMEFVNLSKLYKWAKVDRYALTTGQYKNAGAEYAPLTDNQRALFKNLLNQVLAQFKSAVMEGRKMKPAFLDKYADGRVFTGEQAVQLGFADQLGTWEDARRALGEAVGLGSDPKVFRPSKHRGFWEMLEDGPDKPWDSLQNKFMESVFHQVLRPELMGQPLFLLPGTLGY